MANFLIRGGYLLTMDEQLGDIPSGDVLVVDGEIRSVGDVSNYPSVEVIDARGTLVLPGIVETHWHTWTSLLRGLSDSGPEPGYFAVLNAFGPAFRPQDTYQATLLAGAEAIHSGITTLHDWSHNTISPEHADASIRALTELGVRARYSYGWAWGQPNHEPMDLDGLRGLRASGLVTTGMAWRGAGGDNPELAVPPEVHEAELTAARELGLPVTVHASGARAAQGQIARLAERGLLGADLQVVHAVVASPAEIRALAGAGAVVSVSPFSELRIGFGTPQVRALLDEGVPVGLSVDSTVLTGNADPFGIMKVTQASANGRAEDEFGLSTREVLRMATIDGARSLGLADRIGSLTPGKRADLVLVDLDSPNLCTLS
jgi:cytosine/adenosine deaminase-related metal-dependent hydrolase